MSTEVNHDSGDAGDTGEHGGYQGGDNGQESGYGHDDSGYSDSGNDEDQNSYGHESASEDESHQFSPMQEHMGFKTGFGPAADLPRNAFGVPEYRGFSMPDNKANSLSFGKSPESYGAQRSMTFGTSFDPNSDLRKNAFGVPEYRGFRMPGGGMYSPDDSNSLDRHKSESPTGSSLSFGLDKGLPKNAFGVPEYRGFKMPNGTLIGGNEQKDDSWFGNQGLKALVGGTSLLENWKMLKDPKTRYPGVLKALGAAMMPEKFQTLRDDINMGDIPNDFRDVKVIGDDDPPPAAERKSPSEIARDAMRFGVLLGGLGIPFGPSTAASGFTAGANLSDLVNKMDPYTTRPFVRERDVKKTQEALEQFEHGYDEMVKGNEVKYD